MVHVVHTFDIPLHVVVDSDGVVVSSPKGLDIVLTPKAAEATAEQLTKRAAEALSRQSGAPDVTASHEGGEP